MTEPCLLAVDLGLRTGIALFHADGRLLSYRSQNFGQLSRLKKAIPGILRQTPEITHLVVEGDRQLGELWFKPAHKRQIQTHVVRPETWRQALLLQRKQRSGTEAKKWADQLARAVIAWSGLPKPSSLRHDAAEAILIGLWGVMEVGWLEALPEVIERAR